MTPLVPEGDGQGDLDTPELHEQSKGFKSVSAEPSKRKRGKQPEYVWQGFATVRLVKRIPDARYKSGYRLVQTVAESHQMLQNGMTQRIQHQQVVADNGYQMKQAFADITYELHEIPQIGVPF